MIQFTLLFGLEKFIRLVLGFIFSIILVNSLTPLDYSQFELVGNFIAVLSIFLAFGSHGFATKINVQNNFNVILNNFFELKFKALQLSVLLLFFLYLCYTYFNSDYFLFIILFTASASKSLSDLDRGILDSNERGLLVLYTELLIFSFATVVRCVLLVHSFEIAFIALVYATEALLTICIFRGLKYKQNFTKVVTPSMDEFFKVSATYWIYQVLSIIYVKSEIFLINYFFTKAELATVAFSSKFVDPLAMLGLAFILYYRQSMVRQSKGFWKRLSLLSGVLSIITILIAFLGALITKIIILPFVSEIYLNTWIIILAYIPAIVSVNVLQLLWIPIQKFNFELHVIIGIAISLGILSSFSLLPRFDSAIWFLFTVGCLKLGLMVCIAFSLYFYSRTQKVTCGS